MNILPRGSTCTTIRELGPKIPYYRRNYGSQFPNDCICGPSGLCIRVVLLSLALETSPDFELPFRGFSESQNKAETGIDLVESPK